MQICHEYQVTGQYIILAGRAPARRGPSVRGLTLFIAMINTAKTKPRVSSMSVQLARKVATPRLDMVALPRRSPTSSLLLLLLELTVSLSLLENVSSG